MDIVCVLDLNMERDRDIFMMEKLNELQEDDYVIFVNYKGDIFYFYLSLN